MENYNDWTIKSEKLQEYYADETNDFRCCPVKYTWEKVKSDNFGNKLYSYIPFDAYRIPRNCVDTFIDDYCSDLPKYGIYVLFGQNEVYVGKTTNNDRAHSHNVDPIKGNWFFQYLFVPNNNCEYTKTYWNNENFMALLESLLIDKLYNKFGSYYKDAEDKFKNKVAGQDLIKSKSKLNDNIEQIKFAELVADWISYAYTDISGDSSFIMTQYLNKDWVSAINNGTINKTVNSDNEICLRNKDIILKRIQDEIDPSVDNIYFAGRTCLWAIDERLNKEFTGTYFSKEVTYPHFHFELASFKADKNIHRLVIHLESKRSIGDENYELYTNIFNEINKVYKPIDIVPNTIDNAISIIKQAYPQIKSIIDNYFENYKK